MFWGCASLESIKIPNNASIELRQSIYRAIITSYTEAEYYPTKYKLTQEILFQNNLEDMQRIKGKANFECSQDYDEFQMDIFYAKMIESIGIEEIDIVSAKLVF